MKSFLFKGLCLAVLTLLLPAHAVETNLYTGPEWRLMEVRQVIDAGGQVTAAQFPDSDSVIVDMRGVRVYREDGTGEAQDETFVKVLTEKGRRENRTLSLMFMLPYFTVEVTRLEVIRPDGTVLPVDVAANSKESIDDSQMAMNIYDPNTRVLRVNIPKLEVGDVVHSVVRQTMRRAIMQGAYAEVFLLEMPSHIRHMAYEIHAPDALPLKHACVRDEIKGAVSHAKKAEKGGVVHTWEVRDVPRMFEEPAMPSYERVAQRLLVSTLPDWQAVSRWYWELSKGHMEVISPEIKQQVAALTAGLTNDLEKTQAIFYYVSKNIRYMGLTPEKDRPGFEPHDVSLTFEKKYGVCRDKAALLVAMLREAGLNAYPVLINVGTKRDAEVPELGFNHAIAGVDTGSRNYVLMDPTDENTQDLLPDSDRDQSYLVCRPEGERLLISPVNPAEKNLVRVTTTGTLDGGGTVAARTTLWFDGVNDNAYRNAFAQMKPDDLRRFFETGLKRAMPGASLVSFKIVPENMLDTSSVLHAELEFSVSGMIASGNGRAVVSLPWLGERFGLVNFILQGAGLDKRKYPFQTSIACGLQEKMELRLAPNFTEAVSMPDCKPVEDAVLGYSEAATYEKGVLKASRELKLKIVEFSPEQYLHLKEVLKHMEYDQRKSPVMACQAVADNGEGAAAAGALPRVESDSQVLEAAKEIDVQDAHHATYRARYVKRVLTYNGKKRDAEVKIEFNPSCQSVRLLKGVVVSKDGQRREIAPGEINIMDAGWNGSARRYTGGKVLVANLPGVEIGSTVEVEVETVVSGKPFLAGYEAFQMGDAIDSKQVRLIVPTNLPVHSYAGGASGIVRVESYPTNASRCYQWTARDVQPFPAEPQLPPEWVYAAGIGYFAGNDTAYWQAVNSRMLECAGQSKKAVELARELAGRIRDRVELLKAIRDHVAKSIRQAGPSFVQLPLSELSAADTTLGEGYGHMADRAILLHAMLKATGFEPEFVMASGLAPVEGITNVAATLPLPQSFDQPLVRVVLNGEAIYLNDTDQYAHPGSTPHDGRLAFVPGKMAYETIHAARDCKARTDISYAMAVSENGKTRIGIRRQFFGSDYNAQKRFYSELPPEERKRHFQEMVSGVAQGARPAGGLVTRFDAYPGIEEFAVEMDEFAVVDGRYLYFELPFAVGLFGGGADRRALPYYLPTSVDRSIQATIQLPPGFRAPLIAPAGERLELPGNAGAAVVTATNLPGAFTVTYDLKTSPAIIKPADYPAVIKVESALGRKSSRVFLLERNN